jgi:hypothetical protein
MKDKNQPKEKSDSTPVAERAVHRDRGEDTGRYEGDNNGRLVYDIKKDAHDWRCIAASVTGTGHLETSAPCQDSYDVRHITSTCGHAVVIAVSDGAGSASRSDEGSRFIATQSTALTVEYLSKNYPEDNGKWITLFKQVFENVRALLMEDAKKKKAEPKAFAATLILVVLTKNKTICGLIGDCVCVGRAASGEWTSFCPPQKGRYANMTNFITQADAMEKLDITMREEPMDDVAVMSDGLLELAVNVSTNTPHPPFFKPLFRFVEAVDDVEKGKVLLERFLNSDRVNERSNDDKTLVLAQQKGQL